MSVVSNLAAFRQLMTLELPDIQAGKKLLSLIKIGMIQEQFRLIPPFPEETIAQTRQQLLIARNIIFRICLHRLQVKHSNWPVFFQ